MWELRKRMIDTGLKQMFYTISPNSRLTGYKLNTFGCVHIDTLQKLGC